VLTVLCQVRNAIFDLKDNNQAIRPYHARLFAMQPYEGIALSYAQPNGQNCWRAVHDVWFSRSCQRIS
jgi:hypothetical protein